VLGIRNVPSLEEVDQWKKEYKYGKSLYNPAKLHELGTQMYKLHEWYMGACAGGEHDWIGVKVRDHHYFHGNDVMWIQFNELHQLCHMDSLDKSLLSCYCL
jgi:dipeptidase